MKVSAFQVYRNEFVGCDRDAGRVAAAVESRAYLQPCLGRRVGDEIDDDLVADQWLAAPVLCDVAEHAVFDLVPLAGAGREVADVDGQAQLGRQVLQGYLPEPAATAVAATTVGRDQEPTGVAIPLGAHLPPPTPNRFHGETGRIVVDAHAHPALVRGQVVDAIGNGLPEFGLQEVVDLDLLRPARRTPLASAVLERPDQLLLLRIDRDHRLPAVLKRPHGPADVQELGVAVRVRGALHGLAVALQAVPCLLYTSDAADDLLCVDLGGRRIIKKK